MKKTSLKFWSFQPRFSLLIALLLLILLMLGFFLLRHYLNWPGENAEITVLIGIMLFSLLPVVLAVVDVLIERGGVVEISGLKFEFSKASGAGMPDFAVPDNIGAPGQPISDSGTMQILESLQHATANKIVVIDLKDGYAWWETRLLVLLAGAVRLQKPEILVFTAKVGNEENCFQGWAYAKELWPLLLRSYPPFAKIYHTTQAAVRQWGLVEPIGPNQMPALPTWVGVGLASRYQGMAFDYPTGLPRPLFPEQLFASELGEKIEKTEPPRWVSLAKMEELFRSCLHNGAVEESNEDDQQISAFFEQDADYIAITEKGKYKALASRTVLLSEFVKALVIKKA